jgi:flavin-binding protein dodecin
LFTPLFLAGSFFVGIKQYEKNELKSLNEKNRRTQMTIARITEVTSSSKKSFEDAVKNGVERASKTLKNVSGAWVKDQEVGVKNGKVTEYRVKLKITFVLED